MNNIDRIKIIDCDKVGWIPDGGHHDKSKWDYFHENSDYSLYMGDTDTESLQLTTHPSDIIT